MCKYARGDLGKPGRRSERKSRNPRSKRPRYPRGELACLGRHDTRYAITACGRKPAVCRGAPAKVESRFGFRIPDRYSSGSRPCRRAGLRVPRSLAGPGFRHGLRRRAVSRSNPVPSSRITSSKWSSPCRISTQTCRARECLTTLVSASWATRKHAIATSGGRAAPEDCTEKCGTRRPLRMPVAQPPQGGDQAEVVEHRRAQVERKVAHLANSASTIWMLSSTRDRAVSSLELLIVADSR